MTQLAKGFGQTALKPIHLDTWNSFVFPNFAEQPSEPLADYLGSLGVMMDTLPLDDYPQMVGCLGKSTPTGRS